MAVVEAPPRPECGRCGSAVERGQEYCLECGARLPLAEQEALRAPASWLWPVLVALAVAALAAAGVVAYRLAADGTTSEVVATTAQPAVIPTTTAPEERTGTGPASPAAPPAQAAPAPPPVEDEQRIISWPQGRGGYTVVLASLPEANGRPAAADKARDALEAGLRQVGVLRSDEYATLHPGYFVVFAGVYPSMQAAEEGVSAARRAGYDTPYAREIAQ